MLKNIKNYTKFTTNNSRRKEVIVAKLSSSVNETVDNLKKFFREMNVKLEKSDIHFQTGKQDIINVIVLELTYINDGENLNLSMFLPIKVIIPSEKTELLFVLKENDSYDLIKKTYVLTKMLESFLKNNKNLLSITT